MNKSKLSELNTVINECYKTLNNLTSTSDGISEEQLTILTELFASVYGIPNATLADLTSIFYAVGEHNGACNPYCQNYES